MCPITVKGTLRPFATLYWFDISIIQVYEAAFSSQVFMECYLIVSRVNNRVYATKAESCHSCVSLLFSSSVDYWLVYNVCNNNNVCNVYNVCNKMLDTSAGCLKASQLHAFCP